MKINKTDLKTYTEKLLRFLADEKVFCDADLENLVGKVYKDGEDEIEIVYRLSYHSTPALCLTYTDPNCGIPIEVRINYAWGYTNIFIKSFDELPEFRCFGFDRFSNKIQEKIICFTWLDLVKGELEKLLEL